MSKSTILMTKPENYLNQSFGKEADIFDITKLKGKKTASN
jgi:hypothetical protein